MRWAIIQITSMAHLCPSEKEGLFGDKKNQTKLHSAEKKLERGDPLHSSGFVGYV